MASNDQMYQEKGSAEQVMAAAARSRISHQLKSVLPVNAIEDTVFSVSYITTTDNEMPNSITWILTLLDDFQLLSFALNPQIHHDIPFALAAFMEPTRLLSTYTSFSIANVLALVMVFSTITLAAVVSMLMHRQTKVPISALKALRILFTLIVSTLNIPIATLFFGGINCTVDKGILEPFDIPCFRGIHLPLVLFNTLGLLMFVPLILLASVVLIETSPTSTSPSAKAHGQVELRSMGLRIVFVILDAVTPTINSSAAIWLYMIVTSAGLVYLTLQLIQQQPYFDSRVTMLRSGLTFASAAAMIANMVLTVLGMVDQGSWIFLLPAAVVGFLVASFGSKVHANRYLEKTVKNWHEVCRGELMPSDEQVATTVHGIGQQTLERMTRRLGAAESGNSLSSTPRRLSASVNGKPPAAVSVPVISETHVIIDALLKDSSSEAINKIEATAQKKREKVFDSPLQVEVCVRFVRENPTEVQVVLALQLLERGLIEFPSDPLLLLLAATYLAEFYGLDGQRAADVLIQQLHHSSRSVPLAVKYLAYARQRAAQSRGEHVLDKAALDALNNEVRKSHLRALFLVRNAWESIRIGAPLSKLAVIVSDLSRYQVQTEATYRRLLEKSPRDKTVLRAYASFLSCCKSDGLRAEQLMERAEEVELHEMKQRPMRAPQRLDVRRGSIMSGSAPPVPLPGAGSKSSAPASRRPTFAALPNLPNPMGLSAPLAAKRSSRSLSTSMCSTNRIAHSSDAQKSMGGLNYTDSQASGGSGLSRFRGAQRRVLCERLGRPLRMRVPMLIMSALFLGALTIGLCYCLLFFERSLSLLDEFMTSRTLRSNALETLQSVRTMALTRSRPNLHNEYLSALSHMRNQTLPVMTASLSTVAEWKVHLGVKEIAVPEFEVMYTQRLSLAELTSVDVINRVMQAATLVVNETDPITSLGNPAWTSSSLQFLSKNLDTIVNAIMVVAESSVEEYNRLIEWSEAYLLACMFGSVLALVGLGVLVYSLVINTFFQQEDRVLHMLLKIPKKTAATLLTQAEEDLETFREVTELDGTDEQNALHSSSGTSLFAWLSSGTKRASKVKVLIALIAFGIGCLVGAMLGSPLMSTSLREQIDWLVTSGNRRYRMQSWLVYSQEAFFTDGSISHSSVLKSIRSNVRDIAAEQANIESISANIHQLFPNATIYPRNCTLASSCPSASDLPDVGFTRSLATMSLEAEADLLMSVISMISDHLALQFGSQGDRSSTSPVDTSTRAYKTWLYGRAVATDVIHRVQEVHSLALARVHREVGSLTSMCVGLFVLTLCVFGTVGYVFNKVAVRKMLDRTEAIVALMFLIGSEHIREVPEIGKLIETGGLMLFMKSDEEETAGK